MAPANRNITDTTEQASIDRERTAMDLIHASLNSGPWSMEFDEKGEMTSCVWSDTFRHMLGYIGKEDFPDVLESWSDLLHEEDKPQVMRAYWDTVLDYSGVRTYDVEYRLRTRDRGWRWFHAAGRLARREDGSPVAFYGLFVDIDEQKKMEQELQHRTEELQEALEKARYADQAKTKFLSSMSHDLRTPMNAIMGFTNLALKSNDLEVRNGYLADISIASGQLLELINKILGFSDMANQDFEIKQELADIGEVRRRLEALFRLDAENKGIVYTVTINVLHPSLYIDLAHSIQMMTNLLSNAIQYTPEGGSISVFCTELAGGAPDSCVLETVIRDTGIGMSGEFLPHAFETFAREKTSTLSGIQGAGLGLSVVKHLVDLMGGTIRLESAPGQGTTVTLRIPHRLGAPVEKAEKKPEGPDLGILKGKRILLTEDIDINALIATELLAKAGCTVERAKDGVECVEMIKEADADYYALVLMDIQMPNMNGYDASRAIRAMGDPKKAGIPILALTANAFQEDIDKSFEAGMNGHIAKPINPKILFRMMAETLWIRQSR